MAAHKDFEIWQDKHGYYHFKIDYWGHYVCMTLEEAEKKCARQRKKVQERLEEIERLNQEYFAKQRQKEEEFRKDLHSAVASQRRRRNFYEGVENGRKDIKRANNKRTA